MTRKEIIEALAVAEAKANKVGEELHELQKQYDKATDEVLRLRGELYDIDNPCCNICDFARPCGIPDGVLCTEEHHQKGKDKWQCYSHRCEYGKCSGKVKIY